MKNNTMTVADLVGMMGTSIRVVGSGEGKFFDNVKSIAEADERSLVWVSPARADRQTLVENTRAPIVVCDESIDMSEDLLREKCFIVTLNPRLVFARIVRAWRPVEARYVRHPTAIIHPEAVIPATVSIGPHTTVGRCVIGEGTTIDGNCFLYDGVRIGRNARIHAGTIVGGDGFGYIRGTSGEYENFPHVGGVTIGDNVEIGSNTCIDRGSLGDTVIADGVKIDNLVHVAHNVRIGRRTLVIAGAVVGGSTVIGEDAWIAPQACLRDGIRIGDRAMVGMGAVVTGDVADDTVVMGSPAVPADEFKRVHKKMKRMAKADA
jgi:UDP-3-O-[3-hydroxymyristoyl] glucosamine N-acyltransferase